MKELKEFLNLLPSGKITDTSEIEQMLVVSWEEFTFTGMEGGMAGHKISGRIEGAEWNPPLLSFTIERHGAMKFSSSRAELQHWVLNINTGEAGFTQGYREKSKRLPPLKTKPLAEDVGKLIVSRKDDKKLKWYDDKTCIKVIIGEIIPDNIAKQSLASRRKRFRRDLTEFLSKFGWQEIGPNNYRNINNQ
ncbi:MAG: hypothetical protein ACYSR3_13360 [Planctomycetota bacterium]